MGFMEKIQLYQEQYNRLEQLSDAFLLNQNCSMEDIEYLILERERCLLMMKTNPIDSIDQLNMEQLMRKQDLSAEEQQQIALYQELKRKNRQLVNQDQAVNMKLRNIEKQNVVQPVTEKKQNRRQVSVDLSGREDASQYIGRRFNRLR